MASLIPHLNSCLTRMQAGEKRVAQRLMSHLDDECLCWYEPPMGSRPRYTDFIVLHPLHGLLLLEVKDWRLSTIEALDKTIAVLRTPRGRKTVCNPLEQARRCTHRLVRTLERDPQLIHPDGPSRGRLRFPYGYGVILSRITRQQFHDAKLGAVLPEPYTMCRDEMSESTDPVVFQQRLWAMVAMECAHPLTPAQVDRIRWHVFPEIRIEPEQTRLFSADFDEHRPDLLQVLDLQQEQLARSLGEGHRVIHGVAGSGKTLILLYRGLYLAGVLRKPIVVLCYNIALAARLTEMIEQMSKAHHLTTTITVHHFHGWCTEQLRLHRIDRPPPGNAYCERLVTAVIEAVEAGKIPRAQYGAVLIDEGHDFEPAWLRLLVEMVDPETNALLLLYDDAQSIYGKRTPLGVSLSSVGIQARGRTSILRLNYRNTDDVLAVGSRFIGRFLRFREGREEELPLLNPQSAGRRGPPPEVRIFSSFAEETWSIARTLSRLHDEQGRAWAEMCVLYRFDWIGNRLHQALDVHGIPCDWLRGAHDKKTFCLSRDTVKLLTMHSSKGLEFPVVAIAGLGYLSGAADDDLVTEAKLLYVAMTRSTDTLLLTGHQETLWLRAVQEAVDSLESPAALCASR